MNKGNEDIHPIKETALLLYLMPLGGVVWMLDKAGDAGKYTYKKTHALGTHISLYIQKIMKNNNLT